MAERDDKGFFIRIDWNVNDIRLLNDIVRFYEEIGAADEKELKHLEKMKLTFSQIMLEYNYHKEHLNN